MRIFLFKDLLFFLWGCGVEGFIGFILVASCYCSQLWLYSFHIALLSFALGCRFYFWGVFSLLTIPCIAMNLGLFPSMFPPVDLLALVGNVQIWGFLLASCSLSTLHSYNISPFNLLVFRLVHRIDLYVLLWRKCYIPLFQDL